MNTTLESNTHVHIDEQAPAPAPINIEDLNIKKFARSPGDDGTTTYWDTPDTDRVSKNSPMFAVVGTLFELNASLGIVRAHTNAEWAKAIPIIQQHLLEVQHYCSCVDPESNPWRDAEEKILFLVAGAKQMSRDLQGQAIFFPLPGGHPVAAYLDLARAICWRVERAAIGILKGERPEVVTYLNRLSTVLNLMARRANRTYGIRDIPANP